jgi:hypothetical protein
MSTLSGVLTVLLTFFVFLLLNLSNFVFLKAMESRTTAGNLLRLKESEVFINKMLEEDADNKLALYGKSLIQFHHGNFGKSAEILKKVVAKSENPDDVVVKTEKLEQKLNNLLEPKLKLEEGILGNPQKSDKEHEVSESSKNLQFPSIFFVFSRSRTIL